MENITIKSLTIRIVQIFFSIMLCIIVFGLLINLFFPFKNNYYLNNPIQVVLTLLILLLSEFITYISLSGYKIKKLVIGVSLIFLNMVFLYFEYLELYKYSFLILLIFLIGSISLLIKKLVK